MGSQYSAKEIAQWFINRAAVDVMDGGEYLTHLKLQKLLYYAQGSYLAIKDKPLFKDEIYCWTHGPVVASVYAEYKKYSDNVIDDVKSVSIDQETVDLLEEVYNVFGQYSALYLRNMTHSESPWKETMQNDIISKNKIKEYFKEHYIEK